jgi:hypothetical protein
LVLELVICIIRVLLVFLQERALHIDRPKYIGTNFKL